MTAEQSRPLSSSVPRQRPWATVALVFSLCVIIGAVVWYGREPLLRDAAELWIVSDPVGPADAVVVLGGGLEVRPFAAADYYRQGITNKILVAQIRVSPSEKLGVSPSHTVSNRDALIKLGVPENRIETFGTELSSTYQEAMALREWAVQNRAKRIVVPTEVFSSRRVRWMMIRALAMTGAQVSVPALDSPEYTREDWWKHGQGIIAFQNEVIKYIYYRLVY